MPTTPSLKGLQAFEVAARTGSFAAAATELAVSPAAVSQLIRALENQVGRRLFHRVNRRIVLTEAGGEILPRLSAAFEELRSVAHHLSGAGPRPRLVVSVPPSMASAWLATRIAAFINEHGALDISIRSEEDPVAFDRDLIDLRVSYGRVHYREQDGDEIVTDGGFALCSPAFAERWNLRRDPTQFSRAPLIHTDWGRASATFPPWQSWFDALGLEIGPNAERGMIANSSQVAMDLAAGGQGLVLSQGLLAASRVEAGQLILAHPRYLDLAQPYVVTVPARATQRSIVQRFVDWLRHEMMRSVSVLMPDRRI